MRQESGKTPQSEGAGESAREEEVQSGERARLLSLRRRAIQRKQAAAAAVPVEQRAQQAAALGTSGAASALPHSDAIQRSFGRHDISQVKAHTDGRAAKGSAALGADAFTVDDRVAFARPADLRTSAHEAAHVVQQRSGAPSPGVGREGDAHEQHADQVADRVVQGKSSEDLLDRYGGGGAPSRGAVQRVITKKDGKPFASFPAVKVQVTKQGYSPTEDQWGTLLKAHLAPGEMSLNKALGDAGMMPMSDDEEEEDEAEDAAGSDGGDGSDAAMGAGAGAPTGKGKGKGKAPAEFDPDAAYSDSEDEAHKRGNKHAKKYGKTVLNYTKRGRGQKGKDKVDNYIPPADVADAIDKLKTDAHAIHDLIPKGTRSFGATTITTAIFFDEAKGVFKKFAFCNADLMAKPLREKAESLGYHVVRAQKGHAEAEMIQYAWVREGLYTHENMAVDKEHCAECEWAMDEFFGTYNTQTGFSGKVFKKYHSSEELRAALGKKDASTPHRHADGSKKDPAGEDDGDDGDDESE